MNPTYGYQLYQAERVRPRAEIIAGDVQRGRQAAAGPGGRRPAGQRRISTAFTLVGLTVTVTRRSPGRSRSRRFAWYFAPTRSANE